MSTKVTRGNERIVAPQHEQPIRFTRQRMTEINQESMHSATVPTQHNLSPTTNYDLTHSLIVPTQPSSSAATNHESTQSIDILLHNLLLRYTRRVITTMEMKASEHLKFLDIDLVLSK
jgi:hypothetical protein